MRTAPVVVLAAALGLLGGCQSDPAFEEIGRDQREILYKLGGLEKAIQLAGSAPAGGAAPSPNVVENDKVYPDRVYTIPIGDSAVKGPKEARVTLIEFSDFQCPPCGESRQLLDRLLREYPKDLKLVYKVFPLTSIHPNALGAARAAIAAGKQGKFWEMHDIMYENQTELAPDKLAEYAKQIGLDVPRWQRDVSAPETQQQVARDVGDGRAADVDATPTFFVNGKRVTQRSMDDFKKAIDGALKAS
jgi:protein-disulfide isomerase